MQQRRAFKREKIQSVQPYSAATSDDEEVSTSSKYQKKRRKDIQKEKIPHEASSSKSGFENASLSVSKRSSRERFIILYLIFASHSFLMASELLMFLVSSRKR